MNRCGWVRRSAGRPSRTSRSSTAATGARVRTGAPRGCRSERVGDGGGARHRLSRRAATRRGSGGAAPVRTAKRGGAIFMPSDPMLFRYSALTFNSHRIHYDYPYVTEIEGYPGPDRARAADRDAADRPVAAEHRTGGRLVPVSCGQPAVRYRPVLGSRGAGGRGWGRAVGAQRDRASGDGGGGIVLTEGTGFS